jgi:hypothetical protein
VPPLPAHAAQAYEELRAQVVREQAHPDGLGAIVFHGMWYGLSVLLQRPSAPATPTLPSADGASRSSPVAHDLQLVRLLANMVLLTQSKEEYAY